MAHIGYGEAAAAAFQASRELPPDPQGEDGSWVIQRPRWPRISIR